MALRAGLHVSARFDYRIALGTADVLQPLPSTCISQYGTALIGCNSGCFSEHDTRLQMFIGGRFWLGYKLYAQAGFSVFQVKIGSSTEWSVDISSLNWDRYLGALCYYFFPPSPPPPPPSSPPSPLPPPPPHHQENVVVIIAAGSGALAVLLLATYLRYTGRLMVCWPLRFCKMRKQTNCGALPPSSGPPQQLTPTNCTPSPPATEHVPETRYTWFTRIALRTSNKTSSTSHQTEIVVASVQSSSASAQAN